MKCAICKNDPTSHSFHKINENENMVIYYTCPSIVLVVFVAPPEID